MKTLLTSVLLLSAGLSGALANTGDIDYSMRGATEPGIHGDASRVGESVLVIRDWLPWGGDVVPFFIAANTVVTEIDSYMLSSTDISDYCMVFITTGTAETGTDIEANLNAAVGQLTSYVMGGGVVLYQTGTWGAQLTLPGGVITDHFYESDNYFTGPNYLANGMPYPMFSGNYASHDFLVGLPNDAQVLITNAVGDVTAARYAIGAGQVLALTQPIECYVPGGWCFGTYEHFNTLQENAIEYARSLGDCGEPLEVSAQLDPATAVNCLGDPHTVTVTILDENDDPVVGQEVVIEVFLGPSNGLNSGALFTDGNGQASFTYTSWTEGLDLLVATFANPDGGVFLSNTAQKLWEDCQDPVDARESLQSFALGQNFPNPFNPTTTIAFSLPETAPATLTVHNLAGETVATLVDGVTARGEHQIAFDGAELSSGLYIYRLESQGQVLSGRMLLVK
jgi:hypothetical protein